MKYIIAIILSLAFVFPVYASEVIGVISSGISTGISGILMSAPTASPAPNSYSSAKNITLTGGEGTQFIQYTTNSGTLNCSLGNTYSAPISVATSTTIQAISCYPNGKNSGAVNFVYVISSNGNNGNSGGSSGGTSYVGGGGGGYPPPVVTNNADFNGDGNVDIMDLAILSTNWGSVTATHSTGDTNGDGNVDITDLSILSTQWTG